MKLARFLPVRLPVQLKVIKSWSFSDCTNLKNIHLPISVEEVGEYTFARCPNLSSDIFNTTLIHYSCDLARGGRRYIMRDDDGNHNQKLYPSGLWPIILYRTLNEIELPNHVISTRKNDDDPAYTRNGRTDTILRRTGIVYVLLVQGIVPDISSICIFVLIEDH